MSKIRIVYDIKLRRPGCALLQATLGGDPGVANKFDTETWLLSPTPDLRCYELPADYINMLVEKTNERFKEQTA